MKTEIKRIMNQFFIITTGSVGGAVLFTAVFYPGIELSQSILWQILLLSFLTACMTIIFHSTRELTRKEMMLRQGLHFIVILSILIIGGLSFGWIKGYDIIQVIAFSVLVAVVYVLVCTIVYCNDKKTTDKLNEKLKAYQDQKE